MQQLTEQAEELLSFLERFKRFAPKDLFPQDPWRTLLERETVLRRLVQEKFRNPHDAKISGALAEEVAFWCDLLGWAPAIKVRLVVSEWR